MFQSHYNLLIMSVPVEVCIIEDQPEVRSGISYIINSYSDFFCTPYANAEAALQGIKQSKPQVVLMDINLPGIDGIECTRLIRELYPDILVMMCTVFEDSEKIFDALKAGANGYILKKAAGETLINAIKELISGGAPMSSDIARKVVESFRGPVPGTNTGTALTRRENEILELLGKGYGNKEIAEKLSVSVYTVRTHVYNIYEKLHVRNRVEALNKTGRKVG